MDITHVPRYLRCFGCDEYMDEYEGKFNEIGDFFCEFCVKGDEHETNMVE